MKTLEGVRFNNGTITDAGLVHLAKCTQLKFISFDNAKITAKGLADLRKALPGCEILPKAAPVAPVGPSDGWKGLELVKTLPHKERVADAMFSPDGSQILTTCYSGNPNDLGVYTWETKTGKAVRAPERILNVGKIATGGGKLAFSVNAGGLGNTTHCELVVWNSVKWVRETKFAFDGNKTGQFVTLEVSRDGKTILASLYTGDEHITTLFDSTTGETRLKVKGFASGFVPEDGGKPATTILVANGMELNQIDLATEKVVRTLKGHTESSSSASRFRPPDGSPPPRRATRSTN